MPVAQTRGVIARVVGDLLVRLAGGERWEFAVFSHDDKILASGSSRSDAADAVVLRAELRLQRFAGVVLPHVGPALASEERHALVALFGAFPQRVAVMRIVRSATRPFSARDGNAIERFLRRHGTAIAATLAEKAAETGYDVSARRAAPIVFIVDGAGALVSTAAEPPGDPADLRTYLMPHDGAVSPVLRPVVDELTERYAGGATGDDLVVSLPFALVRLTPLRARSAGNELLISVEWLRSHASLESTAARYAVSKRELQVLSAMLRGALVSEIAAELSISESTVVFHLKRMLKKTGSKNRTELAARMLGWNVSA